MVRLNRIYTRTGDDGSTGLADGTRLPKDAPRLTAIGAVDEVNAALGLARLHAAADAEIDAALARAQNDLFDLGADLAWPDDPPHGAALRVAAAQTARLEAEIDAVNQRLAPLTSFVLPGGTAAAAALHQARVVARRAERAVITLARAEPINPEILRYINRLSDLLFVLARAANDDGRGDVLWRPGGFSPTL